jgi:hypothetical protein
MYTYHIHAVNDDAVLPPKHGSNDSRLALLRPLDDLNRIDVDYYW